MGDERLARRLRSAPFGMDRPEIRPTPSGYASLFYRGEYLDDPTDPIEAAHVFVEPARLEGAKRVILFGSGLGYRVAGVLDTGAKVIVFEPCPEALELAKEASPELFAEVPVFTSRPAFLSHLLSQTMAGQKTVLLVPPVYRRLFPEAHAALVRTMEEAEGLKQLRHNTVRDRYQNILEAALTNLPRVSRTPMFTALGRPLEGTPAFIVSAGPSLDRNGSLLTEAAKKGAVFTVNTAGPAVAAHHGSPIDVLTCIEALDVTASLTPAAARSKALAIDVSSAPANFDVTGPRPFTFLPSSDPFIDLAKALGGRSLRYGASVATAAFALAEALGADPIVLVGQDLAYTDGKMYAEGTGRGHYRATLAADGHFDLGFDQEMIDTFKAKGVKAPPKRRPALEVPGWGGTRAHTTHDMILFLRWFEAARERTEARCVNATEGGARIEGFEEATLRELLGSMGDRTDRLHQAISSATAIGEETVDQVRRALVRNARDLQRAAERCLKAKNAHQQARADEALLRIKAQSKYVELHATPSLLRLREEEDLSAAVRRRRTFTAIRNSARRVAKLAA